MRSPFPESQMSTKCPHVLPAGIAQTHVFLESTQEGPGQSPRRLNTPTFFPLSHSLPASMDTQLLGLWLLSRLERVLSELSKGRQKPSPAERENL